MDGHQESQAESSPMLITSSPNPGTPALALSDIIHVSPPPSDLNEEALARMRQRVQELGRQEASDKLNERERELINIALQLTSPTYSALISQENTNTEQNLPPEPLQLLNQAETISTLVAQRDLLIEQVEFDRAMWESERAGWDRIAEALIAAKNANGKGNRRDDSDLERQCAAYESDNKTLREKLTATQSRLAALEAELSKLRPLLLLHSHPLDSIPVNNASSVNSALAEPTLTPFEGLSASTPRSSISLPSTATTIYGTSPYLSGLLRSPLATHLPLASPLNHSTKRKGKEREVLPTVPEEVEDATSSSQMPSSTSTSQQQMIQSHPPPHSPGPPNKSRPPLLPRKGPKIPKPPGSSSTSSTTFSDARSEHILLAARRLGRLRTNTLAGIAVDRDRDQRGSIATTHLPPARVDENDTASAQAGELASGSTTVNASPGGLPQTPKAKGRRAALPTTVSPSALTMLTPSGLSASVTPTGASPYAPWYGYGYYPSGVYGVGRSPYGVGAGVMGPGVPASPTGAMGRGRGASTAQNTSVNGRGSGASAVDSLPPAPSQADAVLSTPKRGSKATAGEDSESHTRKSAPHTPLDSLLSAARMMDDDGPRTTRQTAGVAGGSDVEGGVGRPQRAGRGQKKKDEESHVSRRNQTGPSRRSGAASTKVKDSKNTKQTAGASNAHTGKGGRASAVEAGRSKKGESKKRQAETERESRSAKRRRISDSEQNVTDVLTGRGHEEDDDRHSTSLSNGSTGARLIATPQFVPVTDDGADPGRRSEEVPLGRVRSALDVLADQASAAASEVIPRRRSSTGLSSSSRATDMDVGAGSAVEEGSSRSAGLGRRMSGTWVQREEVDSQDGEGVEADIVGPRLVVRTGRVRAPTEKERDRQERQALKKSRGGGKGKRRPSAKGRDQEKHSEKGTTRGRANNTRQKERETSNVDMRELSVTVPGVRMISPPNHGGLFSEPMAEVRVAKEDSPMSVDSDRKSPGQDREPDGKEPEEFGYAVSGEREGNGEYMGDDVITQEDITIVSPTPAGSAVSDGIPEWIDASIHNDNGRMVEVAAQSENGASMAGDTDRIGQAVLSDVPPGPCPIKSGGDSGLTPVIEPSEPPIAREHETSTATEVEEEGDPTLHDHSSQEKVQDDIQIEVDVEPRNDGNGEMDLSNTNALRLAANGAGEMDEGTSGRTLPQGVNEAVAAEGQVQINETFVSSGSDATLNQLDDTPGGDVARAPAQSPSGHFPNVMVTEQDGALSVTTQEGMLDLRSSTERRDHSDEVSEFTSPTIPETTMIETTLTSIDTQIVPDQPDHPPIQPESSRNLLITPDDRFQSSVSTPVVIATEPDQPLLLSSKETPSEAPQSPGDRRTDVDLDAEGEVDEGDEDAEGETEGDQDSFYDPISIPLQPGVETENSQSLDLHHASFSSANDVAPSTRTPPIPHVTSQSEDGWGGVEPAR